MISDEELLYLAKLQDDIDCHEAQSDILKFTAYNTPEWETTFFHKIYYDLLEKFAAGIIKRLIISVPPQHGKSQGSSRMLPSYLFGVNPNLRIALASYNATFASKFNRQIQRIIVSPEYHKIFPDTTLNGSNVVTSSRGSWLRNSEEFEIVDSTGYFKSVGVGGGLTGNTVDIMVMDDLYKDYQDATSPTISERVWDWYVSVVKTRLHNDSQELIVFTRWDENDIIGRLEQQGKVRELGHDEDIEKVVKELDRDTFLKINFEALKTGKPTKLDPREPGEALWPSRHGEKKLKETRDLDPVKFDALYQGNPRSAEGLLYEPFRMYSTLPPLQMVKSYIDTADEGKDYLCAITYGVPLDRTDQRLYILDVYYTQDPVEKTENETAHRLDLMKCRETRIESNNGGKAFARNIDRMTSSQVTVKWFHQSANKIGRTKSNSGSVNRCIEFPIGWDKMWPEFYRDLTSFKRDFTSKHDDAPDCLTGVYETEHGKKKRNTIIW